MLAPHQLTATHLIDVLRLSCNLFLVLLQNVLATEVGAAQPGVVALSVSFPADAVQGFTLFLFVIDDCFYLMTKIYSTGVRFASSCDLLTSYSPSSVGPGAGPSTLVGFLIFLRTIFRMTLFFFLFFPFVANPLGRPRLPSGRHKN